MEKFVDRVAEWLPLGMGEARRNFVSGAITVAVAWLFRKIAAGGDAYSYIESIEWFALLFDKHAIFIFLFFIFIVMVGKIVDFVGGLFPIIYNFLLESDFNSSSVFKLFRVSLYRSVKRRRQFDIGKGWSHAFRLARRMDQKDRWQARREKEECFKSALTDRAKEVFDECPDIVKDGLVRPFGWNFDISVNFMTSQADHKTSYWIIHRENRRKFVYVVLCSVFAPFTVLLLAIFILCFFLLFENLDRIIVGALEFFKNGVPEPPEIQKGNLRRSIFEEDKMILPIFTGSVLFFTLFWFYIHYVKSCCIQYAEVFALSRYMPLGQSNLPVDVPTSKKEFIPQIGVRRVNRQPV